jgi:hypothetical protein
LDIEAAFLEGEIDELIHIKFPEGMDELGFVTKEEMHSHCVELGKYMYGNVDTALRCFRTLREHLAVHIGMRNPQSDPCVFYLKDGNGRTILIVASHVDDYIMAGPKAVVRKHAGLPYERRFWSQKLFLKADL